MGEIVEVLVSRNTVHADYAATASLVLA